MIPTSSCQPEHLRGTPGRLLSEAGRNINPTSGRVDALFWHGDSYYNALQVQGRLFLKNSLNLQISYTWGKSIDTGSATIAGDQFANSVSSLPWYDLRLNRGPSDFNIGQNLSVSRHIPVSISAKGIARVVFERLETHRNLSGQHWISFYTHHRGRSPRDEKQ